MAYVMFPHTGALAGLDAAAKTPVDEPFYINGRGNWFVEDADQHLGNQRGFVLQTDILEVQSRFTKDALEVAYRLPLAKLGVEVVSTELVEQAVRTTLVPEGSGTDLSYTMTLAEGPPVAMKLRALMWMPAFQVAAVPAPTRAQSFVLKAVLKDGQLTDARKAAISAAALAVHINVGDSIAKDGYAAIPSTLLRWQKVDVPSYIALILGGIGLGLGAYAIGKHVKGTT